METTSVQTIKLIGNPEFLSKLTTDMGVVFDANIHQGIPARLDADELKFRIAQHTRDSLPDTADLAIARMADAALSRVDFEVDGKNLRSMDHHIRAPHVRVSEIDPYVARLEWSTRINGHPVGCKATFDLAGDQTQVVSVSEEHYPFPAPRYASD